MTNVRLIRIGLRQFAAGMLSILALGILNRIMKVEMNLDLSLVSVIIGLHYFAAPLAIPLGHLSDRRPIFGFNRTPYILLGTGLTVIAILAAPFVAFFLDTSEAAFFAVLLASIVFFLLGVGIYTAGTAYLSFIADITTEQERGKAVAVVWSMMMVGILAGVFLGVGILDQYTPERLVLLFSIMACIVAVLTVLSIWGLEPRAAPSTTTKAFSGREVWSAMLASPQTRLFFAFLFMAILFLFLQNTVLEPFGGDVFTMDVGSTTRFNAYQMVGVLSGMAISGRWLSNKFGNKATAGLGLLVASFSFGGLFLAALIKTESLVTPAIILMGFGMGLFNVGGLALMMGMSVEGQTGMYMGAWTLSQALANGLASFGGGLIHDLALTTSNSEPIAYAVVFAIEALGLLAAFILLQQLSLARFQQETHRASVLVAEAG